MGAYDDKTLIESYRIIEFECEDEEGNTITCQGRLPEPSGMQHGTRAAGVASSQIPFRYQVWHERAELATCCYWQEIDTEAGDVERAEFSRTESTGPETFRFTNVTAPSGSLKVNVFNTTLDREEEIDDDTDVVGGWEHEVTPSFYIHPRRLNVIQTAGSIPTRCQKAEAENWHQGRDGTPPCNGAKTQCPYYTGATFKYSKDEDLAPGQNVSPLTVQELRHFIKDWEQFDDPQGEWERSFEIPYIWARDFNDLPLIIGEDLPGDIEAEFASTLLAKTLWDVTVQDGSIAKEPSQPSGTGTSDLSGESFVPDFPTLIGELDALNENQLKVTFPPVRFGPEFLRSDNDFIYEVVTNPAHTMYLAGVASANSTVFIVNSTIRETFKIEDQTNEEIGDFIQKEISKLFSSNINKGFKFATANNARFWELGSGIDLKLGINKIYCLTFNGTDWNFVTFTINYKPYVLDIIQRDYTSTLPAPDGFEGAWILKTASLINEEGLQFRLISQTLNDFDITRVYHAHFLDKSIVRFITGNQETKDERYWAVERTEKTATGTSNTGTARWSRLDNCNNYLIEFTEGLSQSPPLGLTAAYNFTSITLNGVTMRLSESVFKSNSPTGALFPTRFIIVEPENNQDMTLPALDATVTVNYEEYIATNESGDNDEYSEIITEYPELRGDLLSTSIAGAELSINLGDTTFNQGNHEINVNGELITVDNINQHSLSYIAEITSSSNGGKSIGYLWFMGCGETADIWARSIDIKYTWRSVRKVISKVIPDYARALGDSEGRIYSGDMLDAQIGRSDGVVRATGCGDHDVPFGQRHGYNYYPYESCFLDPVIVHEPGLQLLYNLRSNGIAEDIDEKYRGFDIFRPNSYKYNPAGVISPCVFPHSFRTFFYTLPVFNGIYRFRGPVTKRYNNFRLTLGEATGANRTPPFGNRGRQAIRIRRSLHYLHYLYAGENGLTVGLGWLPQFPFISKPLLDQTDNGPRTVLDNSIEQEGLFSIEFDYNTFEGQQNLIQLSSDNQSDINFINIDREIGTGRRFRFEDVYRFRRVRDPETGAGTLFPSQGYYFNFRNPSIVWAWQEADTEIVRETAGEDFETLDELVLNTEDLTGVLLGKVKGENWPKLNQDKLTRPVSLSIPEGTYTVTLEDQEYDPEKGEVSSFAKLYLEEQSPVYFNRFTGAIQPSPNLTDEIDNIQPYAISTVSGLDEYGGDLVRSYYYEPEAPIPVDNIPGLDVIENYEVGGELYKKENGFSVFFENDGEPIDLDENTFKNTAFLPSIKIDGIIPTLLPKSEVCVTLDDDYFTSKLEPLVTFSLYHGPENDSTKALNGASLKASREEIFECGENASAFDNPFTWSFDKAVLPFTITIDFVQPIDLSEVSFNYLLQGKTGEDDIEFPVSVDPAISIVAQNAFTSETLTVFEKARIELFNDNGPHIIRRLASSTLPKTLGFYANKITITVGPRNHDTSISLSPLLIRHLKLRSVSQQFTSLESRYWISTGYASNDEAPSDRQYTPAQFDRYLSGTVVSNDMDDGLEAAGIAEKWYPGYVTLQDDETVYSKGKLSRNYAGPWKTADTLPISEFFINPEESDVIFSTTSVEEAESKQNEEIKETINKGKEAPTGSIYRDTLSYFLLPQDKSTLKNLGVNSFTAVGDSVNFTIDTADQEEIIYDASRGTKEPGWQFQGYQACIRPDGFEKVACTINLSPVLGVVTMHTVLSSESHGVCGPGFYGETFADALWFGNLVNPFAAIYAQNPDVLGPGSLNSTLSLTNQGAVEKFEEALAFRNAGLETRLQEYVDRVLAERRGRYKP